MIFQLKRLKSVIFSWWIPDSCWINRTITFPPYATGPDVADTLCKGQAAVDFSAAAGQCRYGQASCHPIPGKHGPWLQSSHNWDRHQLNMDYGLLIIRVVSNHSTLVEDWNGFMSIHVGGPSCVCVCMAVHILCIIHLMILGWNPNQSFSEGAKGLVVWKLSFWGIFQNDLGKESSEKANHLQRDTHKVFSLLSLKCQRVASPLKISKSRPQLRSGYLAEYQHSSATWEFIIIVVVVVVVVIIIIIIIIIIINHHQSS